MSSVILTWRQLHWPRPLDPERVRAVLRAWAADQRSPRLVLEARSSIAGVVYLLGMPLGAQEQVQRQLATAVPGLQITAPGRERSAPSSARRIKASTRHRALRSDDPVGLVREVLGSLTRVREGEELILQLALGPRRIPLAVPTQSPSSLVAPWWGVVLRGDGGVIDSEKRTALRTKVADHGFACSVRLGVVAASPERRRNLLLSLYGALRVGEAAGVQLRLSGTAPAKLAAPELPRMPWTWPLRLGVQELVAFTAWPVGDEDLPGQPTAHPRLLPPAPGTTATLPSARIVARATAPGVDARLALSPMDALHHTHVLGPTGTGKSTLLASLIRQDMAAGLAVVVIDPQGDLVNDVLARVPDGRRNDVIVLDPSDAASPVGLNPLTTASRDPEVVADGLLGVFRSLYGDNLGPRSQDILHACLLTLTRRDDASLVMLPLLLTNPGFRRSLTGTINDPIALGPFWAWFEALSEGERHAATAPIMNKLRQWLIRASLRNVLGQRHPRLSVAEVFAQHRILLVSLAQAQLGPEGAALLGSLVVAELWQATQARARLTKSQRQPVMVYLDEFSAFLHLPTDLADALARSRGMGVGYTLAHQFLSQLTPAMRSAVLANTRSRMCFQLAPDDASAIARGTPELVADDFAALGRFEVYASLFAHGQVNPFASGRTLEPSPSTGSVAAIRRASRERYGQPLDVIEAEFAALLDTEPRSGTAPERFGRTPRRAI